MRFLGLKNWGLDSRKYKASEKLISAAIRLGLVIFGVFILNFDRAFDSYFQTDFLPDGPTSEKIFLGIFILSSVIFCVWTYLKIKTQGNLFVVSSIQGVFVSAIVSMAALFSLDMTTLNNYANSSDVSFGYLLSIYGESAGSIYATLMTVILVSFCAGCWMRRRSLDIHKSIDQTSKSFGSAEMASKDYLRAHGFYEEEGSLLGKDQKGDFLRYELCNRTIISSTGGGKSAGLIIPALLTENRPVIVHDIKGELWAVTAKHRAENFKRKIIAIDPFGILKDPEFKQGKSEELCQSFTINPLDYIPTDERFRDRAITTLGKSLVVPELNSHAHWEENAKILLGGLIEYILQHHEEKTLLTLHDLITQNLEDMEALLKAMHVLEGCPRAQAAAGQILKVANEERGSIYSTTYRQVQWLVDSNLRNTFAKSNFDLKDFLKGDIDIYVVIPADQVKSQSRVIRMIFSTITSMLIQTPPSKLPKTKILSIFDELGQLGYNDDVEWSLEVTRAYGVVNWCVFQDVDQIELYQKPNLFKNAKVKQFFEIDDPKTMEWIQTLGGKRTILTENISENSGISTNTSQIFNKNNSRGEGRSTHETAADLIHTNEIRELSSDEQFVFVRGYRAIKCKKIYYFKELCFQAMAEGNPLEFGRD